MKKTIIIAIIILSQILVVKAQVTKKTIVEHFTNTKCSICASRNPGFQTNLNLHLNVYRISIHPSAPYSTCFLSLQNTAENDARANYYNVYGGTPRLVINGTPINSSTNYSAAALFTPYTSDLTPFTITIKQYSVSPDSIKSEISIKRISSGTPSSTAKLFAGLAEDTVFGNGGNGETIHYNVLRKALFTASGLTTTLPSNIGDSLVVTKTEKSKSIWNYNRILTFAILQDVSTNTLIQSELSSTQKSSSIISSISSIEDEESVFNIYPTPSSTGFTIENFKYSSTTSYDLMDNNAHIVKHGSTDNSTYIDVSELANGTYYLRLLNNKHSATKKIIIIH